MLELFWVYAFLRLMKHGVETWLATRNRRHYLNPNNQATACDRLKISPDDFAKTLAYTEDKYWFGTISGLIMLTLTLLFLGFGGLGWCEDLALQVSTSFGGGSIATGLGFFAALGLISMIAGTPLEYISTFHIEEKHGFNRQTLGGFVKDRIKGLVISSILGGAILSALIYLMEHSGPYWWLFAWGVVSGFSILIAWIFPTLLAPLFNKFSPLEEGELKESIHELAKKIEFRSGGVYIMDASRRSSHGNAYFTGMFGEKRIVLFDTLLEQLSNSEIVGVLAHELGHFKLHHVRRGLMVSVALTGVFFYILNLCLPLEPFYEAFQLNGSNGSAVTSYGALAVFTLWFSVVDFYLTPFSSWLSRRHEFAADAFALRTLGSAQDLANALLKLREHNHGMPLSDHLYSGFYYSHPPLLERLDALGTK